MSSKYVAVLVIPSAALEAASSIPEIGLMINPETPCHVPVKNPLNPRVYAPWIGLAKTLKKQ